jgi:hypothetical protein
MCNVQIAQLHVFINYSLLLRQAKRTGHAKFPQFYHYRENLVFWGLKDYLSSGSSVFAFADIQKHIDFIIWRKSFKPPNTNFA